VSKTQSLIVALAATTAVTCVAAPTANAATPPPVDRTQAIRALSSIEARASWHRLWGPTYAWTGGPYNSWKSNLFRTRSQVLGINFRCWRGGAWNR
jgi:hypothetical protein